MSNLQTWPPFKVPSKSFEVDPEKLASRQNTQNIDSLIAMPVSTQTFTIF
jgi:hypothetical protein